MIPVEKDRIEALEKEMKFLTDTLKEKEKYYLDFIKAHKIEEDKGLKKGSELFSCISEKWMNFMTHRGEIKNLGFVYLQKEAEAMTRLTVQIEGGKRTIGNAQKEKRFLSPEEVLSLIYIYQNVGIYCEYVLGRDYITCKFLEDERPNIQEILQYAPSLFFIDAYAQNSLLKKITTTNKRERKIEILRSHSLLSGLNQLLFSLEDELKEYMQKQGIYSIKESLIARAKVLDSGKRLLSYAKEIGDNAFYTINSLLSNLSAESFK